MRGPINVPGKIGALLKKHLSASNPHNIDKTTVGLSNVPNVATNDQTPTFTIATTLATLTSGEKMSVAFGKIAKALDSYIAHLSASNPHGLSASDIGAETSGAVSTHNSSTTAHSDIRELITGLTTRLNALADSDDITLDQLSEIVAYIKSNKSLIDAITTSKVSVTDIVDNLVTNNSGKPLSAAQGVALKALIDTVSANLSSHTSNKSNPHGVTLAQLGVTATASELNALDGCGVTNFEGLKSALAGAKIQTGSYVGTGTYGASNPCSLTFDFVPKVFAITSTVTDITHFSNKYIGNLDFLPVLSTNYTEVYSKELGGTEVINRYAKVSTDRRTLVWYTENYETAYVYGELTYTYFDSSEEQLNESGVVYYYLAIG